MIKLFLFLIIFSSNLDCADITYNTHPTTLTNDVRLSLSQRAVFAATMTLDGAGFYFNFPVTNDQVFLVNAGYSVTLTNILLNNASNNHFNIDVTSVLNFGSGTVWNILQSQNITNKFYITGNTKIIGSENVFNLSSGLISIADGATLTFSNLVLSGFKASNFVLVGGNSKVVFENVVVNVTDNYVWNKGSFLVKGACALKDGILTYASGSTSTVDKNSSLIFSNNLTFSYDPAITLGGTTASKLNLTFTDSSSWLVLDNSSLYVTTTGMQLLKGSGYLQGKSALYSDATLTTTQKALIVGNNDYVNDFNLKKFSASDAGIDVKTGVLIYNNKEVRVALKYGDGLALQHNNYGFYSNIQKNTGSVIAAARPATEAFLVGSSTISSTSKFIIAPLDIESDFKLNRWGNPNVLGQPVKSGDLVMLFSYNSIYGVSSNVKAYLHVEVAWNDFIGAPVSTPTSTYIMPDLNDEIELPQGIAILRIYKLGAQVGAPIFEEDPIYFIAITNTRSLGGAGQEPWFLGSAGFTFSANNYYEIFWLRGNYTTSFPSLFTTKYIWKPVSIDSGIYSSLSFTTNSQITTSFAYGPSYSTYSTAISTPAFWQI